MRWNIPPFPPPLPLPLPPLTFEKGVVVVFHPFPPVFVEEEEEEEEDRLFLPFPPLDELFPECLEEGEDDDERSNG